MFQNANPPSDHQEPLAQFSAMWTDLYQLTMSQALFLEGTHTQQATFHAFVRSRPFKAPYPYIVTSGQGIIAHWLSAHWSFSDKDISTLAAKKVPDKTAQNGWAPLFKPSFLEMLRNAKLELSIDAMPEGEIAFISEPIYKVSGPIWQCLAVETAILNAMNSQSNFATYASMLKIAANGKPVIEFGTRRAQSIGALSTSRAAYVGGIDATSNCLAESVYGINSVGTMSHAYIMAHEDELDAFCKWSKHNPHLGVFLVDTYDTLEGVKNAIDVCRSKNIQLLAIRLDSGDLAYLSHASRQLMDAGGFNDVKILASNDLNIATIHSLEQQGAPIDTYCVGTNLATLSKQPALGGVYKIGNIYRPDLNSMQIASLKRSVKMGDVKPSELGNRVRDVMKLSEQQSKMTYPGELDLVRYLKEKDGAIFFNGSTICPEWVKDPISCVSEDDLLSGKLNKDMVSVRQDNHVLSRTFQSGSSVYRPLRRLFHRGKLVHDSIDTIHIARLRAEARLKMLDSSHKRFVNPHSYIVGVEETLLQQQRDMCDILGRAQ